VTSWIVLQLASLSEVCAAVPLELVKPHAWVSSIAETVLSMNGAKTKQ
jgi:hypothetical protein